MQKIDQFEILNILWSMHASRPRKMIRTANFFGNRNIDIINKETSLRLLDDTWEFSTCE